MIFVYIYLAGFIGTGILASRSLARNEYISRGTHGITFDRDGETIMGYTMLCVIWPLSIIPFSFKAYTNYNIKKLGKEEETAKKLKVQLKIQQAEIKKLEAELHLTN